MVLNSFPIEKLNFQKLTDLVGQNVSDIILSQNDRALIILLEQHSSSIFKNGSYNVEITNINESFGCVDIIVKETTTERKTIPLVIILSFCQKAKFSLKIEKYARAESIILQNMAQSSSTEHHIILEKGSQLKNLWCILNTQQKESSNTFDNPTDSVRRIDLESDSFLDEQQIFLPQTNLNLSSNTRLLGEHAKSYSFGCYLGDYGQLYYEPIQEHFAPAAKSELSFNTVLSKRAKSLFRGLVILHKEAQKSEAYQQNKNLLLSRHARADSEPRLEIIPHDVMCKHGSATAELDKKQLYYLTSRGFTYEQAKNMIVQSFCETTRISFDQESFFENLTSMLKTHCLQNQSGILS